MDANEPVTPVVPITNQGTRGGQVPLDSLEDDAMWDRIWNELAAEEAEDAANQAAIANAGDVDERASVLADILGGVLGNDAHKHV